MHTLKAAILTAALVVAAPTALSAQQDSRPLGVAQAASSAIMEALLADVEQVEQKMIALAEAIPQEAYDWRPGAGVRSVGEVMRHVAADNWFLPTFVDVAAPASTGITASSYPSVQAYEARELDQAATIAELRVSFEHLKRVMREVDESELAGTVTLFGMEMTGLRLWVLTVTHLHEHLGQSIAYARSNGVVPPWSRASE
ncbi:MAG TPA: DinB family protein [Longimicrobiales bacterium]|nr:DinB family protein [Longimicrobiales bacterium]